MNRKTVGTMGVLLGGLLLATSAQAALSSRLGGAAAYDDVLNITWLTDASLSGLGTWQTQVDWAANLDTLGFDDWRLASISVAAGLPTGTTTGPVENCNTATAAACQDNELGYMFYHNLGGTQRVNSTGDHTVGDVTLTGLQPIYWSGTDRDSAFAWYFRFSDGLQSSTNKDINSEFGWAVRAGDVSAIPLPASLLLLGSCLGLLGITRRQRRV